MKIVFMGVGALGSTAAVLCRSLPDVELRFVDFDRVESKNLSAQAFVRQSLGRNKAEALKAQFLNFWGIKTEAFGVRCERNNVAQLCAGAGLVVDCFDNKSSREVLSAHCSDRRLKDIQPVPEDRVPGTHLSRYLHCPLPLLHAAIAGSGDFGIVRWDEDFHPDAEDRAGQATCEGGEHLPMIGLLSAALARTIQDFVLKGKRTSSMVNLFGVKTI